MADRGAPYCHKFIDGGRVECWAREIKHFLYIWRIYSLVYIKERKDTQILLDDSQLEIAPLE